MKILRATLNLSQLRTWPSVRSKQLKRRVIWCGTKLYGLWRSSAGPKDRQAKPHTHIGKKRKPMSLFSRGCHSQQQCSRSRTHDDDDGDGGDAQHGGHTPNKRLTETCSLGLLCTSLILDIHVMINWHLSKQGICWPVSHNYIAGSSVQLIEFTCFLKLTGGQVLVFDWIAGSC